MAKPRLHKRHSTETQVWCLEEGREVLKVELAGVIVWQLSADSSVAVRCGDPSPTFGQNFHEVAKSAREESFNGDVIEAKIALLHYTGK